MTNEDPERPGQIYRRYDPNSERNEIYRINPKTGIEETLVQGGTGEYWQERGRITRDQFGNCIDWEG